MYNRKFWRHSNLFNSSLLIWKWKILKHGLFIRLTLNFYTKWAYCLWFTFLIHFWRPHFNYLECWIISGKRRRSKSPFCEPTADERKLILNVQKRLYYLETWISLTKFERVSSDSSFSRSPQDEVQILLQ